MAARAASRPLLGPLTSSERLYAWLILSVANTPKTIGFFESSATCPIPRAASFAINSKWNVSPRMTAPRQITASIPFLEASFLAVTGISNAPGTQTVVIWSFLIPWWINSWRQLLSNRFVMKSLNCEAIIANCCKETILGGGGENLMYLLIKLRVFNSSNYAITYLPILIRSDGSTDVRFEWWTRSSRIVESVTATSTVIDTTDVYTCNSQSNILNALDDNGAKITGRKCKGRQSPAQQPERIKHFRTTVRLKLQTLLCERAMEPHISMLNSSMDGNAPLSLIRKPKVYSRRSTEIVHFCCQLTQSRDCQL